MWDEWHACKLFYCSVVSFLLVKWCLPEGGETMNVYQQSTHAHSVGWSTWHFEWCTKYRYRMLGREDIKNLCLIAVQEAANKHGMEVIDMEVDVGHVHVIVSIPLTMAPSKALHLLKGFTSKLMFQLVPNFRKRYRKGHL